MILRSCLVSERLAKCRQRLVVTTFLAVLLLLSGNAYSSNEDASTSLSQSLVETAGEVLLEAAKFGLDWSGEKLLGSKGWEGFKRILEPVIERLQEKFPAFKFGKGDDAKSIEAAREAVNYLQQNPELHNLLVQGFNDLKQGQQEIRVSVDRVGKLLVAKHDEQMELLNQMYDMLNNVGELPVKIDLSDRVNTLYLLSKIRARREGREFNHSVSVAVATSIGQAMFSLRVLEEGEAFVRYEADMANATWYQTPSRWFPDNGEGRQCRNLSIDAPLLGELSKRLITYQKFCTIQGGWEPVELLEKKYYFTQ